jgi:hypothetical protein
VQYSTQDPLDLWRRCAKIDQRALTEQVRAALACFCKVDDFLGDYFDNRIGPICKPQRGTCHFECDPHDANRLGIEFLTV